MFGHVPLTYPGDPRQSYLSRVLVVCANPALEITSLAPSLSPGVHSANDLILEPGGKGTNVARLLNMLNVPVVLLGLVGGYIGQYLRYRLIGESVPFEFCEALTETRCSVVVVNPAGEALVVRSDGYRAFGDADVWLLTSLEKNIGTASSVCISGSLPPGLSPLLYGHICAMSRRYNVPVFVDCAGQLLSEAVRQEPFLVKINREEAAGMLGCSLNDEQQYGHALHAIKARGAKHVIISLGAQGAVALLDDRVYRVTIPRIQVRNPIGAGDAMMAGLISAFGTYTDWIDRLRYATGIAVASTQTTSSGHISQIAPSDAAMITITVS